MALQFARILALPFIPLSLPPSTAYTSKTVLITGANTGLGLEAARHALNLGASHLILGVRTLSKGESAKTSLLSSTTSAPKPTITVLQVDLESFSSVQDFSKAINQLPRLDVAILNAGIATGIYKKTKDGWESMLQVNVLSTALLGLLLLPKLIETAKLSGTTPNLCFVTSEAHYATQFSERHKIDPNASSRPLLEALNSPELFPGANPDRYFLSKLLTLYMGTSIASLTPSINGKPMVVVNNVAPGFCKSGLIKETIIVLQILQFLFARSLEKGSKTLVFAAAQREETHGKYLDHNVVARPGELVISEEGVELRQRLWKEVVQVLTDVAPEVKDSMKALEQ